MNVIVAGSPKYDNAHAVAAVRCGTLKSLQAFTRWKLKNIQIRVQMKIICIIDWSVVFSINQLIIYYIKVVK